MHHTFFHRSKQKVSPLKKKRKCSQYSATNQECTLAKQSELQKHRPCWKGNPPCPERMRWGRAPRPGLGGWHGALAGSLPAEPDKQQCCMCLVPNLRWTQSLAWGPLGGGDRSPEPWACPSLWPVAHYPRRMWAGDAQGTRKEVRWEAPGMVPQGSASGQVPSPL